MDDLIIVSEYLVMGAMLCFLFLSAGYFRFLVPRLAPSRSDSTKALHKMLNLQIEYNGLLYVLWLLPVLFDQKTSDFYLEESARWASYYVVMDYLDMTLLPVGMLMGYVVIHGTLPSWKMFVGQIAPFVVAYCLDVAMGWEWLRTCMGIYAIAYSVFQFMWYGRCVRIHQLFLLNSYSNLDGRQMKWYLEAQIPVFLLSLLYYPLCVLPEATWPSIVYDVLTLAVLIFLIIMVLMNEMDDKAYSLMKDIDLRKKKSEIFADAIRMAEMETAQPETAQPETLQPEPVQPETLQPETAQPEPAQPETMKPETAQPETVKPETQEWTRTEKESYDFGDQMKKLEEEEFYLDPDVSIDYLAERLGSNRHYVSDYLNQILKMPFYTYVNSLRLEHAERLLRTSNDKASAIGYLSGFNSEATYRRLFKERYGCTPTQYTKRVAA